MDDGTKKLIGRIPLPEGSVIELVTTTTGPYRVESVVLTTPENTTRTRWFMGGKLRGDDDPFDFLESALADLGLCHGFRKTLGSILFKCPLCGAFEIVKSPADIGDGPTPAPVCPIDGTAMGVTDILLDS